MGEDSLMPSSSPTDWVVRELNRLEKTKADKPYVIQIEKLLEERRQALDKELDEMRLSFAKDISTIKKDAEKHPCMQEEEIDEMNATLAKLSESNSNLLLSHKALSDSQTFWSRWVVKGLMGFIGFLVLTGGAWVYSYFSIQDKAEEAQKASAEVKAIVSEVQQTQTIQAETLKKVAKAKESKDTADMLLLKQELKAAMKEVLADEAANR